MATILGQPVEGHGNIFGITTFSKPYPRLRVSLPSLATVITLLTLAQSASASPLPSNLSDWLKGQILPSPGTTLAGEIQCYNLPYGGIGFLSHVLTYYTVVMMLYGRTPVFPRPGNKIQHSQVKFVIGVVSLVGSVAVAGLNIGACRYRWQFVCIGVWKLTMFFTLCSICSHQSFILWRHNKSNKYIEIDWSEESRAMFWLLVYLTGTLVGMVGLLSLVAQIFWEQVSVRVITGIFAVAFIPLAAWSALAGLCILLWLCKFIILGFEWLYCFIMLSSLWLWDYFLYFIHLRDEIEIEIFSADNWDLDLGRSITGLIEEYIWDDYSEKFLEPIIKLFGFAVALFGLCGAFYCDWILAAIASNWGGVPSYDIAFLYWIYFAAKRLPMLST